MSLLNQSLQLDNLRSAWEAVAENNGIPGVDHVSIKKWRRNWEENCFTLARSVRANTYKPGKYRQRRIPKPDGGFRRLSIPTVTDRVLQRAVMQVLMPVFEKRFFDCSFGYRPHLGLKNAVQRIVVLRENGYHHVLNADIDAFFDNVDQELLLRFIQADLEDESLLPLISQWLEMSDIAKKCSKGLPQGSPLSPLLANIYLHRFDTEMAAKGLNIVRYADDFIALETTQSALEKAYHDVISALSNLQLTLEPRKTSLSNFDEGFVFLGVRFERDRYSYTWRDKEIVVSGDAVDWLFSQYGHEYDQNVVY